MHDGTIAPYALISSLVFTPEEALKTLKWIHHEYGAKVYGEFGFKDAFNPKLNWWSGEYLGIDQGISVLMLENFLNDRAVWQKMMRLEFIRRWIERADLKET